MNRRPGKPAGTGMHRERRWIMVNHVANVCVYRSARDYPNHPMATGAAGTQEGAVLASRLTPAPARGAYPVKSDPNDEKRYVVAFVAGGHPWVWMAKCT